MDEIRGEVIEGAVVKCVFEDIYEVISAITFEKDGKNYKLYTPMMGEPRLIEVEE